MPILFHGQKVGHQHWFYGQKVANTGGIVIFIKNAGAIQKCVVLKL